MGTISIERSDRLFWLGRYTERAFTELHAIQECYDKTLDRDPNCYQSYLAAFGILDEYGSGDNFFRHFLFDVENPNSVAYSLECAYDNGIVLREDISTEALSYLQMALDQLEECKAIESGLRMKLLTLEDILYGFRGRLEDHLYDPEKKALVDCGQTLERLDLYFRLHESDDKILPEMQRLLDRLSRIPKETPYRYNTAQLSVLVEMMGEKNLASNAPRAIASLSHLFEPVGKRR